MQLINKLLIITSAVVLLSGCAAALVGGGAAGGYYYSKHKQKVNEYTSDSWITSKVKSKLLAEKDIKSMNISVSTTNGVVYLTGTTQTMEQRQRAISIAQHTKGVRQVDVTNLRITQ